MRSSPGLGKALLIGVARRHSRAISGSRLLSRAFIRVSFTVSMKSSVKLLAWEYLSELVICSIFHVLVKFQNVSQLYTKPLSLMKRSGMPYPEDLFQQLHDRGAV